MLIGIPKKLIIENDLLVFVFPGYMPAVGFPEKTQLVFRCGFEIINAEEIGNDGLIRGKGLYFPDNSCLFSGLGRR